MGRSALPAKATSDAKNRSYAPPRAPPLRPGPQAARPTEPLRFGKDTVGETLPVFIDHDPDCFNQSHLQMGFVGSYSVAGCDIETKKNEVLTLAGIQITKRHAMMDRDHVVSLAYEFKHHDYQQMRAAFVKAFGQPSG